MKYNTLNDSKLSELESEEGAYELNNDLRTYMEILNKRAQFKTKDGLLADFYNKDPILDIGYIISYPLWIINSTNYSPYGYININKEHQSLINNNKYSGFIYKNNFYLLLYDQNNFYLYSCNYLNNNNNNRNNTVSNLIFSFILNSNKENVINVQFLPNDLGKAYFIVVTDVYNSYLLNINIDNNNINFIFEQCNDKYSQSILAKSFSSLWPFNSLASSSINNISNCFIISPHRQLKKNNNLYTYYNTLFLLSNNSLILKKISFYINNNSINSQIENWKDLSKEIITHLNSVSKNTFGANNSDINVISTDSYFNEKIKTLLIYCFIIYNNNKFILRIIVDNNFYITFDTFDVTSMITSPNENKAKIFVNNYNDEGILVVPNDIIINFNYYNEHNKTNIKGWKSYVRFKKNIVGINKFNQISIFNLDLFTLDQGIVNFNPCLYYSSPNDVRGSYKIEQTDHTHLFLSNFLQGQLLPYIKSNTNNELYNSIYRLNSNNNINNISNEGNLNDSFHSQRSQRVLKPYEIILNNEKKKEFHLFLDEIIKKYMDKNSYLNNLDEKDEYIINKLETYFNNNQYNKNETLNDFLNYINNIINNDNTHIEIIEKSKTKAKLLTVEYLQEKYNKLMILYELLKQCKVEGIKIFDYYPDLLNEFFKIFEKITIGINMRKQENIHLEKIEKNNDEEEKLITLFLENFYSKIKEKLGNKKEFNHLLLFGKISNINEQLLNTFFDCFFYIFNNNYALNNNMDDELNYNEQKDNLLIFIINIIIGINNDIQKLINKFNQDGNNNKNNIAKYNNGLWYLSNNNYICNKYLLQIFKDINLWKTQLYKDSKIDNDTIFLLAEQLHYLFKKYLLLGNNSLKDKSDYINNQKIINNIMINFDSDKAYNLSKKYYDHYTLAKIAFNNKNRYYNDLKEFMKGTLSKKRGHIKYLLQLILEFEIQYINKCKDSNNIIFNYFEDFEEFGKEIAGIVQVSPKLQNFYHLYLLKKDIETKINQSNGHNLVQNIILNMKNNDPDDINNNKLKLDYLIKVTCLDKFLNLIKYSYINNNDINININTFIENINEDNVVHEILQLCTQNNYKNILNNKGDYPPKTFYEKAVKFFEDYFNNYIIPMQNHNEVKENCYIILFLLNECIKIKKLSYNNLKFFIAEICNKCILTDNEYIYEQLYNNDEEDEENINQKINLIYRKTAKESIIIKLSRCFKNFSEIILSKINQIKEDEMNKNENDRITHLLEFVGILYNLIKPENMDNLESNIDNKMDEEEEII